MGTFNHTGSYTCICGESFTNSQYFNSHKSRCQEYLISVNKLEKKLKMQPLWDARRDEGAKKYWQRVHQKKEQDAQNSLQVWISEKHTCEKCGKVMTEKFGSGRFCSRSCANGRKHSEETKNKISASVRTASTNTTQQSKKKQSFPLTYCSVCGVELPEAKRLNKTCGSEQCLKSIFRHNALERGLGGPSRVSSFGKRGEYKGIHCDSTYELAFVVYCLDHGMEIVRNEKSFPYSFQGSTYNYYPDFFLPQYDTYIEVKGRDIGPVYEKIEGVKNCGKKIQLLHYEELVPCFKHLEESYGLKGSVASNNFYKLYDKQV